MTAIRDEITEHHRLHSAVETQDYDNSAKSVYARIKLDAIDRLQITELTQRMVDLAWKNKCELLSLDIMPEED